MAFKENLSVVSCQSCFRWIISMSHFVPFIVQVYDQQSLVIYSIDQKFDKLTRALLNWKISREFTSFSSQYLNTTMKWLSKLKVYNHHYCLDSSVFIISFALNTNKLIESPYFSSHLVQIFSSVSFSSSFTPLPYGMWRRVYVGQT